MQEEVILVDEQNNVLGTAPKATVHTHDTPLHRAFSLFLFNAQNELLLTKRSTFKKAFPGLWTNSVCGHPMPNESTSDAVSRRLKAEIGIMECVAREVAPYSYRFADSSGIVENEICPIFVGFSDDQPTTDPREVDEWKWVSWQSFLEDIDTNPSIYSPWCKEEARIINSLDSLIREK